MTLYRATYRTQAGERKMTFTHASLPDAERYAAAWAIDDQLVGVQTVRPCERPELELQAQ